MLGRSTKMAVGLKYVPVSTAAKMLGVSRQRVYQLLGMGIISGYQIDRHWQVNVRSVGVRMNGMVRGNDE